MAKSIPTDPINEIDNMDELDNREDIILAPWNDDEQDNPVEQVVTLYDENGNPEEFELIDLFEYNDHVYGAFTPIAQKHAPLAEEDLLLIQNTEEESDEMEVVMLRITEDGSAFSEIEDPEEEEAAFRELLRREDESLD